MPWSPSPSVPQRQHRTAWFAELPDPAPVEHQTAWWAVYGLDAPVEIACVTAAELQALKALGLHVEIVAEASVSLQKVAAMGFPVNLGVDAGVTLQKDAPISTPLTLDLDTAVSLAQVADVNLTDTGSVFAGSAGLQKVLGVDLSGVTIGAGTAATLGRTAPINLSVVADLDTAVALTKINVLPLASAVASVSTAATLGFPPNSPASASFTSSGPFTYTFPRWCDYIDAIALGGGASGQTGDGALNRQGKGGKAGQWATWTLQRGNHIAWSATQLTGSVGPGGAQAPNSDFGGPNNGTASTVTAPGYGTLTANGGNGTVDSGRTGEGAGSQTLNGTTYTGGAAATGNGSAGNPPGGGGAGGDGGIFGSRTRGGAGAVGGVWFRAYQ
ncbi:minor tail protein [Mycobacterium phage Brocalys]|uniref:minor tail protein n=1 Tax=Mycobacterium phage Brocalys TaxID=1815608 RepID=UPI00078D5A69|nr:minor tail protein [Mycobacterium phage Brocalys]AMS01727.1 minor tail protein [Mycobacterium phage Brocalys]